MKKLVYALTVLAVLAAVAYALPSNLVTFRNPYLFKGQVGIEYGTTIVYDFPELSGVGDLATVCAYSKAATIKGLAFGDLCVFGMDQDRGDAGVAGTLIPYVVGANTARIQACATGLTDGGTWDIPDASYTLRCFKPTL